MIYKFKSPACGDVIMLGPNGDQMLRLLGREPAAQGIIEPGAMPAALQALQAAIAAQDAPAAEANEADKANEADGADGEAAGDALRPAVGLRQRLWPMVDMLRRSQAAGAAVVWGV
ncbi:MAG: DUF1840 domain-containing protein [Rubrivivax sp.]|nr:DUF1840 domain-containing protein [Rubrivivax sp.]